MAASPGSCTRATADPEHQPGVAADLGPGQGWAARITSLSKVVPHGEVRERWYHSKTMGARRRVFVYTPPDYDTHLDPQRHVHVTKEIIGLTVGIDPWRSSLLLCWELRLSLYRHGFVHVSAFPTSRLTSL